MSVLGSYVPASQLSATGRRRASRPRQRRPRGKPEASIRWQLIAQEGDMFQIGSEAAL